MEKVKKSVIKVVFGLIVALAIVLPIHSEGIAGPGNVPTPADVDNEKDSSGPGNVPGQG